MKKTALVLALLLAVSGTAFAEFTAQEETDLKLVAQNIDKLVRVVQKVEGLESLIDNQGLSTLPLEIEKKKAERVMLIKTRDGEVDAIKAQAISAVNAKYAEYEPQIDNVESEIKTLEDTLDAIV